jgi:hypothetical protein
MCIYVDYLKRSGQFFRLDASFPLIKHLVVTLDYCSSITQANVETLLNELRRLLYRPRYNSIVVWSIRRIVVTMADTSIQKEIEVYI